MKRRFGTMLRRLRRAKKMPVRELALRANVAAGYLSEMERGEKMNPSADIVVRLAKALGVPVTELLK